MSLILLQTQSSEIASSLVNIKRNVDLGFVVIYHKHAPRNDEQHEPNLCYAKARRTQCQLVTKTK